MTEQTYYTNEVRTTLLNERLSTTSHHYFFEVKIAKNGHKYIVFTQRKKVGDQFIGVKIRIFEDEMLEFQRILQKSIHFALSPPQPTVAQSTPPPPAFNPPISNQPLHPSQDQSLGPSNPSVSTQEFDSSLYPAFFDELLTTNDWRKFEEYTHYLLKLLGIQTAYSFLNQDQAGRADGFFKFGNLAVIYDCTLRREQNVDDFKQNQIVNYCNLLQQGRIDISEEIIEEFHSHRQQVWIITQENSRRIKTINGVEIKEVSIRDIMAIYKQRLVSAVNDPLLELLLRDI